MREIKFRAWDRALKKMSYKVNLYSLNISGKIDHVQIDQKQYMSFIGLQCDLMQYTGLKDKNGKVIYEGDIVDAGYGKGKVIFDEGAFLIEWIDDKEANMELLSMDSKNRQRKVLIIGNCHENPELLEEDQ